ncbi:hypothetical protein PRNP1_010284 [Phytophthora ramorum]
MLKARRRVVTGSDPEGLDRHRRRGQKTEYSEYTRQRLTTMSSDPIGGQLKYDGGTNEVSGAAEWMDRQHNEVGEQSNGRVGQQCEQHGAAHLESCLGGY